MLSFSGYLAEYNLVFQKVKANGAVHKVPKPGFLRPAREFPSAEFQAIAAARVAPKFEEKKHSRSTAGPEKRTPAVLSSRALPEPTP